MDVPDCPENWDYLWEGYSFLMVDKSFETQIFKLLYLWNLILYSLDVSKIDYLV